MLYLLHSLNKIFRTAFIFLDVCIPGKTSFRFDEVYNKMSVRNDYYMCILKSMYIVSYEVSHYNHGTL